MSFIKKYNPFKMWGSYIGVISIIVIFLFMSYYECDITNAFETLITGEITGVDWCPYSSNFQALSLNVRQVLTGDCGSTHKCDLGFLVPVVLLLSFIVGWIIQILIKKYWK